MWVLENDGEAFRGKKLWLRPGKKHLIGRTKAEGAKFAIYDKTISKTHLTIEVDRVQPGDCGNPRKRSRIIVEDLGSKIGTWVNDEQIRGRYELQKDYNEIKLGRHKFLFKITWVPVTLTFSFTGKEVKADPFTKLYETLGPLDVKVLTTYERGQTTHVVAKKRNTSKGLQALIDGKFIVNETFKDDIIKAAEPSSGPPGDDQEDGEPEPVSLLEDDFIGNFPDSLNYLPPRGQEPTQRPSEAYAPNPDRQEMFDGYTYIFYDETQFNNLLAPITEGKGKALLRQVIPDETSVDEFVRYVKDVAGEKGNGEFEDGSEGKGVVVVKYSPAKSPTSDWFAKFCEEVSLHLGHRLIEQSEFLDAILNNDASVLRRPLTYEQSGTMAPPASAVTALTSQTLRSSPQPEPMPMRPVEAAPVRKGRVRRTVTSRFKGFDEDEFESLVVSSAPRPAEISQVPAPVESQSQRMFVSQDPRDVNVDSQPEETQTRTTLKRKTPPVELEAESEEDIMEQMAPTIAARKRRREADEAARRRRGESIPPPVEIQKPKASAVKSKKPKKKEEIDVQQELIRRREKEKEIAEAETQALQDQLEGMDIEQIRNLAIIEEVEVKRSVPPPRAHGVDSDRWDDKWNGRKNFKKFRPQGENGPRNLNRVIVPLEEIKKRDYGIGEEYWLEGDTSGTKRKKGKGKETQDSQLQTQSQSRSRPTSRAAEAPVVEVASGSSSSEDDIVPQQRPNAKSSTAAAVSRSQLQSSETQKTQNKRPAANTLTKPAPPKKPRQALRKPESDNDSEDELKFRFRKAK